MWQVRAGYEELLAKLIDRPDGETLEEAVDTNYDQVDIQFLTLLNQKVCCCGGGGGGDGDGGGGDDGDVFVAVSGVVYLQACVFVSMASENMPSAPCACVHTNVQIHSFLSRTILVLCPGGAALDGLRSSALRVYYLAGYVLNF